MAGYFCYIALADFNNFKTLDGELKALFQILWYLDIIENVELTKKHSCQYKTIFRLFQTS